MALNNQVLVLPINIFPLSLPSWIIILSGFILSFSITWVTIPSIVNISRLKDLCSIPNGRTSHSCAIPNLGGIAIFISLILSSILVSGKNSISELSYIIAGLTIIFFVGIKDDILIIDPVKKLAGQILAVVIVAVFADIRIGNMYGLFHIHQLSYMISILFTVFVFIVIINGFNLIDGIDGLAASIGILTSSVFGIWFWTVGNVHYGILSFSFAGTLVAFFHFNVFGRKNKIFLGDSGSLIIGFIMGILVCKFLKLDLEIQGKNAIPSAPTVAVGILIIPLFDSLRVFILRISQGKSPFVADRQHIHHRLLQLGLSHLQATLVLTFVNLFFIILSFILREMGIILLATVILGLACLMTYILVFFAKEKGNVTIRKSHSFDSFHPSRKIRPEKKQRKDPLPGSPLFDTFVDYKP